MNKQKKIFITGATGNIGKEVINQLIDKNTDQGIKIIAATRNVEKAKNQFREWQNSVEFQHFDFDKPEYFDTTIENIDCVFLLRPPQISDISVFKPLIEKFEKNGVREIVFLSVQGAEKSSIIPHNKIEHAIKKSKVDYVFIRPSYFMQNLVTELLNDIKNKGKIILPSGDAKFNWIDVKNIGEVASILILHFEDYKNRTIEITGYENKNFEEVATLLSNTIGIKVEYKSVNPLKFFFIKQKENIPLGKIIVMILLHFLPRFQEEPRISDNYEKITGKKPTKLIEFFEREQRNFIN